MVVCICLLRLSFYSRQDQHVAKMFFHGSSLRSIRMKEEASKSGHHDSDAIKMVISLNTQVLLDLLFQLPDGQSCIHSAVSVALVPADARSSLATSLTVLNNLGLPCFFNCIVKLDLSAL